MAEYNEINEIVVPESPKVIEGQQNYTYLPIATYDNKGIVSFNHLHFNLVDGVVSLSKATDEALKAGLNSVNNTTYEADKDIFNKKINGKYDENNFDTKYFKIDNGVVSIIQSLFDDKLNKSDYESDQLELEDYKKDVADELDKKIELKDGKIEASVLPQASTSSSGIASFDGAVFTMNGEYVTISDDFMNRFKEVIVTDDISKLPAVGSTEKAYIVNGYFYYWDGSAYGKVKTVESIEMPGISQGDNPDALVMFEGQSTGKYSIAGGGSSDDALGDLDLPTGINYRQSVAKGNLSISYGLGNNTLNTADVSVGINNTSGVTGYYWHSIDFANKQITLSTVRPEKASDDAVWNVSNFNWGKGDYISIVNNNKYPYCAEIDSVSGNVITLKTALPFSEIDAAYKLYSHSSPDDRTIFAIRRANYTAVNHVKLTVLSGTVLLGWGAVAVGALNVAAGIFSLAGGMCNLTAGDFAAAFGTDNVVGYAGLGFGCRNILRGLCGIVGGTDNVVNEGYGATFGSEHTINSARVLVNGYKNEVGTDSSNCTLSGEALNIGNSCSYNAIFGHTITLNEGSQQNLVGGFNNTLTGSKTVVGGSGHTVSANNVAVFGNTNKIYTSNSLMCGYNNTLNKTSSSSLVVGAHITVPSESPYTTVLGLAPNIDAASKKGLGKPRFVLGMGTEDKTGKVTSYDNGMFVTDQGHAWFKGKVYAEGKVQKYTYGTELLTPGESELETGTLYFAYE